MVACDWYWSIDRLEGWSIDWSVGAARSLLLCDVSLAGTESTAIATADARIDRSAHSIYLGCWSAGTWLLKQPSSQSGLPR